MGAEEPPELGEKLSGYWQYCWQYLAPSSRLCAQAVTQPGLVLASPRPKPKVCPSPVTWHGNGGPEGPNFQHTLSGYGNGRSLTSREKSKKHECNFALKRLAGRESPSAPSGHESEHLETNGGFELVGRNCPPFAPLRSTEKMHWPFPLAVFCPSCSLRHRLNFAWWRAEVRAPISRLVPSLVAREALGRVAIRRANRLRAGKKRELGGDAPRESAW